MCGWPISELSVWRIKIREHSLNSSNIYNRKTQSIVFSSNIDLIKTMLQKNWLQLGFCQLWLIFLLEAPLTWISLNLIGKEETFTNEWHKIEFPTCWNQLEPKLDKFVWRHHSSIYWTPCNNTSALMNFFEAGNRNTIYCLWNIF